MFDLDLDDIFGHSPTVFFILTVVIFGGFGFMTGQAIARTWRPLWQVLPYGLLLTLFNRFLAWSLFEADALSVPGFLTDAVVILALALIGFLATRAHKMVSQYPWIYERTGPFGWKERR